MSTHAQLPFVRGDVRVGTLTIRQLPSSGAAVIDRSDAPDRPHSAPQVVLAEASEYRYVIESASKIGALEPAELFDPDDDTMRSGRLLTREAVGIVEIELVLADSSDDRPVSARLEVRPRKFADEQAFSSMLGDLAELAVDVLHRAFAPSAGQFASAADAPRMRYQQFALLHQQLFSEQLEWAIAHVLSEPYRSWTTEVQERPPGAPIKGSSRLARSLTRGGPRVRALRGGTMPRRIPIDRTESTLDNAPNRFVRFVLERWRTIAADVLDAVASLESDAARRRGEIATQRTLDRLDELLAQPLLREAGELRSFPQGNQVLIKRDGYRQLAGAAALVESTLGLDLGIDDPLLVSQRSVAQLYELWCFVRLSRAVGAACGEERTADLFDVDERGMVLTLKRGKPSVVHHEPVVAGLRLRVDLFYNHHFREEETWTRAMTPDSSLVIRPAGADANGLSAERWLHFDAKYRLRGRDAFSASADERQGDVDDLLKMHAYRDAILGSAAAYVLFPGDAATHHTYDDEPLPAIGAFPLRPDAPEHDTQALERFVVEVLQHVANQATKEERATYWQTAAYRGRADRRGARHAVFLERPPADTLVLLGYVKSPDHWDWIDTQQLYNVRGDARRGALPAGVPALDAPLLLLYGGSTRRPPVLYHRRSLWSAVGREELRGLGYPEPGGSAYFCCEIERVEPPPLWLEDVDPRDLLPWRGRSRKPAPTTWLDILLARQDES